MVPPVSSPAGLRRGLFLTAMERSFQPWVPLLGRLQRTMMEGEYLPLGPLLPMFESDFLQVTSRGEPIFLHNKENPVTMGVASSLPGRLLPDLILLARPVGDQKQRGLELTRRSPSPTCGPCRLLPMSLARLSVHHVDSRRLKLRLASGRSFYLQLDAGPREGCFLFNRWRYLVYLLRRPGPAWGPRAHKDQALGSLNPECKLKNKTKMSQAGEKILYLSFAPPRLPT
ncbi:Golgi-associated RAB2 interactor protein 5B [Antechinus flavipes]|uniref:Golgi-associated RAB2 interactor protein 5B n=1 Tax=Antechinus flavipes TaxID=38775 RepID=UPI0022361DFF|nr:Golgi-associated RAB2 interactor protein 5B [Antechinus flavipes]